MGWTVVGVEVAQDRAQHTALWGADAQCSGGGQVAANSHSLESVSKKVLYPGTCERELIESVQFHDKLIREYVVGASAWSGELVPWRPLWICSHGMRLVGVEVWGMTGGSLGMTALFREGLKNLVKGGASW